MITAYQFQPYDVLQSQNGPEGTWLDFMTLRTVGEASDAQERVRMASWNGTPLNFRIRRGFNEVVCERIEVPASAVSGGTRSASVNSQLFDDMWRRAVAKVRDGTETPAEDIRNALAILDTLDPNSPALDEVAARLTSALKKIENPATGRVGAGIAISDPHPRVPASLYLEPVSE